MKWNVVCKPVDQGGLGIRSIREMNRALLNKWLWRFGVERQVLWRRVIATRYGEEHHGWRSRVPSGAFGYGVWRGINEGIIVFSRYIKLKVNNGENVSFWHDPWCSPQPLCSLFPSCYRFASCQRGSVQDHMIRSRVWCLWNIHPRRNHNDWENEEMRRLLALLEKSTLGDGDLQDERIRLLDEEKSFSVKSMYEALCAPAPATCPSKFI